MAGLPNPFEFGVEPFAPDEAAVPVDAPSGAAVDFPDISEIFVGARRLEQLPGIFDQAAYTPADELAYVELKLRDDPYAADLINIPDGLWQEFDPPPLFLQMAV